MDSDQTFITGPLLLLSIAVLAWWFWWTAPRRRVPPTISKAELDRLDAEEKYRQTIGQFFASLALIATFALTIYQTFESGRQWSQDNKARATQGRNQRFTEAIKLLAPASDRASGANASATTSRVAALYAIQSLAKESPEEYQIALIEILQTHVGGLAKTDRVKEAGLSSECKLTDGTANGRNREDPDPEVQAAMNLLGARKEEWQLPPKSHFGLIRLERLFLDNLDLNSVDFRGSDTQGALLSNSYFRRVNFRESHLERADFRGSIFADWENPGYPKLGSKGPRWLYEEEEEWRRYRCWVTDFRNANLSGTDFSGAKLGGANFERAVIDEHTNFSNADISRTYFVDTDISEKQLASACGSEQPWLPARLKGVLVKPCN